MGNRDGEKGVGKTHQQAGAATQTDITEAGGANDNFTEGLVLIAEDDEPIAFALSLMVEDAGYTALLAMDGRHALSLAQEQHPALIITDLMMPHMSGQQFIAELRRNVQRHLPPIIVMSAADSSLADKVGADAFLRKPFEIEQVERLLQQFLAQTGVN